MEGTIWQYTLNANYKLRTAKDQLYLTEPINETADADLWFFNVHNYTRESLVLAFSQCCSYSVETFQQLFSNVQKVENYLYNKTRG